jgi:hypothetical protein
MLIFGSMASIILDLREPNLVQRSVGQFGALSFPCIPLYSLRTKLVKQRSKVTETVHALVSPRTSAMVSAIFCQAGSCGSLNEHFLSDSQVSCTFPS